MNKLQRAEEFLDKLKSSGRVCINN